jgi:hypothetical protein
MAQAVIVLPLFLSFCMGFTFCSYTLYGDLVAFVFGMSFPRLIGPALGLGHFAWDSCL